MRYAKIEKNSVANGTSLRVVLWCQGCRMRCEGCHNQSTWSFSDGFELTAADLELIDLELNKDYIAGITFSGGHPLEPENVTDCLYIAEHIKQKYPSKTIWLYTGLVLSYKDFNQDTNTSKLLRLCDVIIDGPYIKDQRDITLKFRGSRNQRVIDVKQTLLSKDIIIMPDDKI